MFHGDLEWGTYALILWDDLLCGYLAHDAGYVVISED